MAKTVVITGSSKGIGAAAAVRFARGGYNTVINYNKSEAAAKALERELQQKGYSVTAVRADMSDPSEAAELIDTAVKLYGRVDCLVANAAVESTGLFTDVTVPEYERVMAVNMRGVFFSVQSAVKDMLQYKSGRIITVSSIWGQVGASCEVLYSAAKAGVIGLTKAVAKELAPSNITVNCVAPGIIETDMLSSYSCDEKQCMCDCVPIGRLGKPHEVAESIFYLAEIEPGYMTGQVLGVNGGIVM